MQKRQGLDHGGGGGLDGGDHGLLPLDCDDGDGQQLMPAAVSWVHLRRGGLKLDSEPHTLNTNVKLRGELGNWTQRSCVTPVCQPTWISLYQL